MEAYPLSRAPAGRMLLRRGFGGIIVVSLSALGIPERRCLAQEPGQPRTIPSSSSGRQSKPGDAIGDGRPAILQEHAAARSHLLAGIALGNQGKLDEAEDALKKAVRLNPSEPRAHYSLGWVFHTQGKLTQAIEHYRNAIRLQPGLAQAHTNLGKALREQGNLDAAIDELENAIRIDPGLAVAHAILGDAFCEQGRLDAAVDELENAIRLKPDLAEAHAILGRALHRQGKLDKAVDQLKTAIHLEPDFARAHAEIGTLLSQQGSLDEAIRELKNAVRLDPDLVEIHADLGSALGRQGKLDEAIDQLKTAIRLKPDLAAAHCLLGCVLVHQNRFAEALPELERGHALGSKRKDWQIPSAEWVKRARIYVDLERRMPAILAGKDQPANAEETTTLADLCYQKHLYGASAGYWSEAFRAQPALADDLTDGNRYNAACSAVLAGAGKGKDHTHLDDAAKARWRKTALQWLKADLALWGKQAETKQPAARSEVSQMLDRWKAEPDLAGVRDAGALHKLPADEKRDWRALWSEVGTLLAKARIGSER